VCKFQGKNRGKNLEIKEKFGENLNEKIGKMRKNFQGCSKNN
jgi:hypothetical protein